MWAEKRSTETEDQTTVSVKKMRGLTYIYDVLILCLNICGTYTYGSRIRNGTAFWRVMAFAFLLNCIVTTCLGWLHTARLFYITALDEVLKSRGALKLMFATYSLYFTVMQTCMLCLSKRVTKLRKEIKTKEDRVSPRWIAIFHVSLVLTIVTCIVLITIYVFTNSNEDVFSNTSVVSVYVLPFDLNSLEGRICLALLYYCLYFSVFRLMIWLVLTGVLCYHIRYKFITIKSKLEEISSKSVISCDVIEELRHTYEQAIDYMRELDTFLSWRALIMLASVLFTDCFAIYCIKVWTAGKEESIAFLAAVCFSNVALLAVIALSAKVHSAIVETLMTYAAVVLQLPSSPA